MTKRKKQFSPHIYAEWGELFDAITVEQRSEILLAITKFPEYEPKNVPIWNFIKSQLQKDYELFIDKCKTNSTVIKNYWDKKKQKDMNEYERISNVNKCIPKLITNNEITNNEITNNEITNNELLLTKTKTKIFIRPSLQEVEQYCIERNNNINAQYFISYYDARGWMIGKNKIKDWKACIRTWELRNKKESTDKNKLLAILKEGDN